MPHRGLTLEAFKSFFTLNHKRYETSPWAEGIYGIGGVKGSILTLKDNSDVDFYFNKDGALVNIRVWE